MFLAYVTHDTQNNTLEAVWLSPIEDADGQLVRYERVKSRNFSPEQKEDFLSECGPESVRYTDMAGW